MTMSTHRDSPKKTVRTNTCGELTVSNIDQEVEICGWVSKRRDHGGVIFIDLRDRYGMTQVVLDPSDPQVKEAHEKAHQVRLEYVLWCKGKVRRRPEGMGNPKITTGEIELFCTDVEVLSAAKTPPFQISDEQEISETLRLKYRYLDLRRPSLQKNIRTRHQLISAARRYLESHDFLEIETPILYKSTPEGARDFVVPSRLNPGDFYALPQSPQTLKQLLMISGFDRYYQIARCFRDEDLRADRQPEFSQIDIETSFIEEEEIFPLMEGMVSQIWKEVLGQEIETPFRQMHFQEAMERFGSDKPDIRFGVELQDLSSVFEKSEFRVFKTALMKSTSKNGNERRGSVRSVMLSGAAERYSRKDLDELQEWVGRYGAKGLLWIKVKEGGELQSPAAKFFTEEEKAELQAKLALQTGDLVFMVADPNDTVVFDALGALRLVLGKKEGLIPKHHEGKPAFLWVTHFPLLEYDSEAGRFAARHHPFTRPRAEHAQDLLDGKNLEKVEAAAYDLVLNGVELAGGSLRIYDMETQEAMFRALNISPEEAEEKFGFFLEALQYGTPPHGGVAFGVERFAAILSGVDAIRDVMAFPKTQRGQCLMAGTPSSVAPEQLVEVGMTLSSSALKARKEAALGAAKNSSKISEKRIEKNNEEVKS
jgi:aspartyl-tRNA synthetase